MLDFRKQQKQPNNFKLTNRNLQPIGIDIRQIQWITTLCDDGNVSSWVFGSDCAQDNMAEGAVAVVGVLPETGETADQQTVDPGAK